MRHEALPAPARAFVATLTARRICQAVTGYYYCCACWTVCPHASDPAQNTACHYRNGTKRPTGSFVNTGRCPGLSGYSAGGPPWQGGGGIPKGTPRPRGGSWPLLVEETRAVRSLGLDIVPTAAITSTALLSEYWAHAGSLESAVELVRREGWSGLGLDNEIKGPSEGEDPRKYPAWDPRLPTMYARFVGNLSRALDRAGFVLVSAVTSTWHGDLGGPEYISSYAKAAPSMRVMVSTTSSRQSVYLCICDI
jgi:hypothetical protein